jgi:drug/metabolite transporter (DMT)-like permease
MKKSKYSSWIIFILLCFIWGSSFKLMKDSTALTATQIAALRIFAAGLVFIPFAIFHINKIPRNRMAPVIASAIFGNLLPAFLFAAALTKLDASLAGILNSLTPLCVVLVGVLFFKARIGKKKLTGVLIGFLGLVLLTIAPSLLGETRISFTNLGYTLLIVAATLLYGINVNMVSQYLPGVNAVHAATVSLAFMTIPTLFILWQQGFFELDFRNAEVQYSVWASAGLGVMGSAVATALFYILVKQAGALFASLVTYGIPFIAIFWGFMDGEKITWIEILCLGIILLGVYMANRPAKKVVETIPAEQDRKEL